MRLEKKLQQEFGNYTRQSCELFALLIDLYKLQVCDTVFRHDPWTIKLRNVIFFFTRRSVYSLFARAYKACMEKKICTVDEFLRSTSSVSKSILLSINRLILFA